MVDPLPTWSKFFVAVVAVALLAALLYSVVDDGHGAPLPAEWRVEPEAVLDQGVSRVPIQVRERECASGRSADGRIVADVEYRSDSITISVGVRTLGGDQTCPSNPTTPFVVELEQPLADRAVEGERWSTP